MKRFWTLNLVMTMALTTFGFSFVGCKTAEDKSQAANQNSQAAEQTTKTATASKEQAMQNQPEQFAGSHILFMYKGGMRAPANVTRSKEEAKGLADKYAKELKGHPDTFAEVAQKNSDCPSAKQGGNLGSWTKGQMVPEFDNAIAKMKVGDISEPIETPFGYHIIKRNAL